jgi:hypothetical protein
MHRYIDSFDERSEIRVNDGARVVSGSEIGLGLKSRAARRKIIAGEGMLVANKSFTWEGERYRAGITRVSPDHPVCDSQYANLLKPAYDGESSLAVLRFLERRRAEQPRPCPGSERWRLGAPYWRLRRRSWRLGR